MNFRVFCAIFPSKLSSIQKASKTKSLSDAFEVVTLPILIGRVIFVGGHQRLLQLEHCMVLLFLKLHFDVGEVSGGPLFVSPSLRNLFTRDNFCELAAYVSTEENESKKGKLMNIFRENMGKTHSPFLMKSILTSPRVKAVTSSTLLKQSKSASLLHWNFSSKTIVLQSIFTPKGFTLFEGAVEVELFMTALFVLMLLTAGAVVC